MNVASMTTIALIDNIQSKPKGPKEKAKLDRLNKLLKNDNAARDLEKS